MVVFISGGFAVLRVFFFFFKQKTAYEIRLSLVGSEMCYKRQGSSPGSRRAGALPAAQLPSPAAYGILPSPAGDPPQNARAQPAHLLALTSLCQSPAHPHPRLLHLRSSAPRTSPGTIP